MAESGSKVMAIDTSLRITGSRPWANWKNSAEFAQTLNKVSPSARRAEVMEILNSN